MSVPQTGPERYNYDQIWRDVYGDMQDFGPVHRHMRRIVAELLEGIDYRSALEVGVGAGHNLPLITAGRALDAVAGVDISEQALQRLEGLAGDFRLLDIEYAALPGTWDLVYSSLVLEHLEDDASALRNMRAMCEKWLLVTTIGGDFERYRPWEEQMGHVRNYAPGELEQKLGDAGFTPVRIVKWGFPFYSPVARRLQNGMKSEAEYSRAMRVSAQLMYWLYYLNSRRRGDLLIALARV